MSTTRARPDLVDSSDPDAESVPSTSRWRVWLAAPETGVGVALVVLVAVFAALEPTRFATWANMRNLLVDASTLTVVAMATTYVLVSRNLDLSIGGVVAFCEVVAAKVMRVDGGLGSSLTGLAAALAGGLVWGALNGLLVTRGRVPAFVATLASLGMAQGAALVLSGGVDVGTVPLGLVEAVGVGDVMGVPVLVLVAAAVVVVTAWSLRCTRFGRHTYAIGSDPVASERAGIDVGRHVRRVYLFAGAAYGLVAWLNLARFSASTIGGHANDALNAITAVALGGASLFGGVGSALGTLIGVFIPAVLRNGLVIVAVQPFWQQIAVGLALALAVAIDQRRRARRLP